MGPTHRQLWLNFLRMAEDDPVELANTVHYAVLIDGLHVVDAADLFPYGSQFSWAIIPGDAISFGTQQQQLALLEQVADSQAVEWSDYALGHDERGFELTLVAARAADIAPTPFAALVLVSTNSSGAVAAEVGLLALGDLPEMVLRARVEPDPDPAAIHLLHPDLYRTIGVVFDRASRRSPRVDLEGPLLDYLTGEELPAIDPDGAY